ncbi:MAG TPA: acyltransferase [Ktedonobacteraceae bacterium]|nr:acyltransferase [Ktedonobacteraceae bacterium]
MSTATLSANAPKSTEVSQKSARRPHIYELDPLRAITALVVVAVHVFAFTAVLNQTTRGFDIQNGIVNTLHFSRSLFMFLTAFSMVYVYFGKPLPLMKFWKKRGIGVLLPYCIWTILYIIVNSYILKHPAHPSIGNFIHTCLFDIVTGQASYQLYYILMTLQFYVILPLFLLFLRKVYRRPWLVLSITFVVQVLIFYLDYHYLQTGPLFKNVVFRNILSYQDRLVLLYPMYFMLGAFFALYFEQVSAFLQRYSVLVVCGMILTLAAFWGHYYVQLHFYHEQVGYATAVLQPIMALYGSMVILFAFWLALRWAKNRDQAGHPKGYRFWQQLSDASFGVYLVHAFFITVMLLWVTPKMPLFLPVGLRVGLTWLCAAGGSAILSVIMINIPIVSRLVGRAKPLPARLDKRQRVAAQSTAQ